MLNDMAQDSQWVVAQHDECKELRMIGNRMISRMFPNSRENFKAASMKNDVVDTTYVCSTIGVSFRGNDWMRVKKNSPLCKKAGNVTSQVAMVQALMIGAQRNGIRSLETAINNNMDRAERAKRARCNRVSEQAQGTL